MVRFCLSVVFITYLVGGVFMSNTHAALPYAKGDKATFVSLGNYKGIDENSEIEISQLGVGRAYYLTDGLGLYGEVLALATRGDREGENAEVGGLGGFFALRWHFLRKARWSLYLNQGVGPLLFFKEFPPGGTKVNALTQYGVGMSAQVRDVFIVNLGVRHVHISNGKGMVADNPSYDGRGFYVEISRPF